MSEKPQTEQQASEQSPGETPQASGTPQGDTPKKDRALYVRIGVSVVLYALFIIFSVSAVLTGSLADKPFLLGGLLVGAVFLLPRSARRPSTNETVTEDEVTWRNNIQKWLTWVRFSYFIIAAFLWFGLPELM